MDISERVASRVMSFVEEEVEVEEQDPRFVEKVRALKKSLPRLVSKKNKKLRQYGVSVIRGNGTVEDLVDALMMVAFE